MMSVSRGASKNPDDEGGASTRMRHSTRLRDERHRPGRVEALLDVALLLDERLLEARLGDAVQARHDHHRHGDEPEIGREQQPGQHDRPGKPERPAGEAKPQRPEAAEENLPEDRICRFCFHGLSDAGRLTQRRGAPADPVAPGLAAAPRFPLDFPAFEFRDHDDQGRQEPEGLHDPNENEGVAADAVDEQPHQAGDVADGDRLEEGLPAYPERKQAVPEQQPDEDEEGREAQESRFDEDPGIWASTKEWPVTPQPMIG